MSWGSSLKIISEAPRLSSELSVTKDFWYPSTHNQIRVLTCDSFLLLLNMRNGFPLILQPLMTRQRRLLETLDRFSTFEPLHKGAS